jgi:hypothetical protein
MMTAIPGAATFQPATITTTITTMVHQLASQQQKLKGKKEHATQLQRAVLAKQ